MAIKSFQGKRDTSQGKEDAQILGFSKTIYNKYYVDEVYTSLIVKPINALSNFFRTTLEPALGNVVYGFGTVVNGLGNQGKKFKYFFY